ITSRETEEEAHGEGKVGLYPSQGNTAPCNPHASSQTSTALRMWMPWEPDTLAPSPEAEVASGLKRPWSCRLGTKVSLTPPIFPPELSCKEALRSIHLYCKPGPPGSPGPCPMLLLLLLLWLGAQPAAQAKYLQLYLACGFDVLAVESVLSRFLCLRRGLGQAARVLALL
ncbi:hypothetical protein J1605_009627, partial [Eschrichtius robustus]